MAKPNKTSLAKLPPDLLAVHRSLIADLEKASTLPQHVAGAAKAEVFRGLLMAAKANLAWQNKAASIRLEHIRDAGKILARRDKAQGGGDQRSDHRLRDATSGPPTLDDLGIEKTQSHRWMKVGRIPAKDFREHLGDHLEPDADKELTLASAITLANRLEGTHDPIPVEVPAGTYSCIVCDPPWPMKKIEREKYPDQAGFDYPTMTAEELEAYPLQNLAADDCHLYLWTTHKFLPLALRLAEAWDFKYQCLMTWVKNVGMTPFSWMYSTEHVLFCRRGNLDLLRKGLRLDFSAKRREHSRKPDEFYDLVRQASPGPRIDVFSREAREGFEQLGDEANKFDDV